MAHRVAAGRGESRHTPPEDGSLWVRRFAAASPATPRLICLPHAGGSASFYLPMARSLAPVADVVTVQYPGRQDRRHEPLIEDLDELAEQTFRALRPELIGPVVLFGHSMGATLAFEIARRIEAEGGDPPSRLFVSGRRAPSAPRDERMHLRGDDELIEELRSLSGTDGQALGDEEIMRMAMPSIRGDYKAAETYRYRPGPPLHSPITVLIGDDDPKSTVEEARRWREHTEAECTVRVFGGGHFYLLQHTAEVLDVIRAELQAAARS
ncbi:surfactin synthase thioesterase subunit [Actinoalloteichus hoggarensis]|uniref:Linear gramicidin dehydrogenase LgrE n=1 Tax=Actinoalloteichus hoggarensis TaxID=1470176 RepID=A0A221W4Y7_9PSEU|nr:alpha/beta fold hydrolase [Actinoalloteichus hoggarensis]ASO20659.1 Linear gramicidin dehydrogenase LgrE [Actinoalloteichus hoggarensis]MBB5924488.1 surfactin synthase thioesterase subunit [Actinoalloteichus hoggarensis]